jgi:glucoamylase
VRAVDEVLKVETPQGVVWRRYNHDGYGEGPNGEPYRGYGQGRAWPLLTGERAHYEFAAGRDVTQYIHSMESFATPTGLLPEQVWDEHRSPNRHLKLGRPTAAAVPLMWAHAEYLKLLRSVRDRRVFDLIPAVADRYLKPSRRRAITAWTFVCPAQVVAPGTTLRVIGESPFRLRWRVGEWQETDSKTVLPSVHFVDIEVPAEGTRDVTFTFYWLDSNKWEGKDFTVSVSPDAGPLRAA